MSMSLNTSLLIASSGLSAVQYELAVASQNVANASTPGYVSEIANVASVEAGGQGSGVAVQLTSRAVNDALQTALLAQNATVAGLGVTNTALAAVSAVQGSTSADTSSSDTLSDDLGNLANGFTALQADPSSSTQQQAILSSASALTRCDPDLVGYLSGTAPGCAAVDRLGSRLDQCQPECDRNFVAKHRPITGCWTGHRRPGEPEVGGDEHPVQLPQRQLPGDPIREHAGQHDKWADSADEFQYGSALHRECDDRCFKRLSRHDPGDRAGWQGCHRLPDRRVAWGQYHTARRYDADHAGRAGLLRLGAGHSVLEPGSQLVYGRRRQQPGSKSKPAAARPDSSAFPAASRSIRRSPRPRAWSATAPRRSRTRLRVLLSSPVRC